MPSCEGCGAPIIQRPRTRQRKWCSDRCRKDTMYGGTCIECGARTDGSNGHSGAPERCARCAQRRNHETRKWTPEYVVAELQAWAAELGETPSAQQGLVGGARVPVACAQREFGSWSAALRAAGFEPRRPQLSGDEFEDACLEAADLYERGLTLAEVGEQQGVDGSTVSYRLRHAGVPIRVGGNRTERTRGEVGMANYSALNAIDRDIERTQHRIEELRTEIAERERYLIGLQAAKDAMDAAMQNGNGAPVEAAA